MPPAFRRQAVPAQIRNQSKSKSFSAPVNGWVAAANLSAAPKNAALRLENFFPTQKSIRPRGGSQKWATLEEEDPPAVTRLFSYNVAVGGKLFAATATAIYDATTPADPDVEFAPALTGQTSGYYSVAQITTTGGTFLMVVNGADPAQLYDGAAFYPVLDTDLSALNYDAETQTFLVGRTLTGGTSGATATIVRVIDNGATGTLWISDVTGTFQNDETITGSSSGGSATANGVITLLTTAITGADTEDLSQVWIYRNRLFFIEGGTMDMHYLGVESIAGALGTKRMGANFKRGGALLLGATWSQDAGDGFDDKCVVMTTEGEVAVFQGLDPSGSDPGDFDLVGVYDIGRPLGKNATMRAGGDLLVMTEDGIVPLSVAINKDPAALSLSAVTRPIEPEWQDQVRARGANPWEIVKWTSRNMAVVSIPPANEGEDEYCFVVNVETGAWTKYTGWDVRTSEVFNDRLYFGTGDGQVWEGEVTGRDGSEPYYPLYIGHADHLGSMGFQKVVHAMRTVFSGSTPFSVKVSVSTDYTVTVPSFPNAPESDGDVGWGISEWDVGVWDESGAAPASVQTKWASIGRSGFAFNPQVQMTCDTVAVPDNELVAFDMLYETGAVMV